MSITVVAFKVPDSLISNLSQLSMGGYLGRRAVHIDEVEHVQSLMWRGHCGRGAFSFFFRMSLFSFWLERAIFRKSGETLGARCGW